MYSVFQREKISISKTKLHIDLFLSRNGFLQGPVGGPVCADGDGGQLQSPLDDVPEGVDVRHVRRLVGRGARDLTTPSQPKHSIRGGAVGFPAHKFV